jgi:hypothetical protein
MGIKKRKAIKKKTPKKKAPIKKQSGHKKSDSEYFFSGLKIMPIMKYSEGEMIEVYAQGATSVTCSTCATCSGHTCDSTCYYTFGN